MPVNPDLVPPRQAAVARLDRIDRRLLGLLAEDATLSYAKLSVRLNLSAPALHERVKRLKRDGVIKATVAQLDGGLVGRSLLTFIQVDAVSWSRARGLLVLAELPAVEEIHTITGESTMLLKVRTHDAQELEELLSRIHGTGGDVRTRSYVVLSTDLERGPSPLADT